MVVTGLAVMFIGYLLLAIPANDNVAYWSMIGALALISLGTGLFKGNLQVMVGNLYDDKRYASKRDTAFSLFYMAINIGAMFAPTAATAMTNWMMGRDGLSMMAAFRPSHIKSLTVQLHRPTQIWYKDSSKAGPSPLTIQAIW